jgi:hypothetical protein
MKIHTILDILLIGVLQKQFGFSFQRLGLIGFCGCHVLRVMLLTFIPNVKIVTWLGTSTVDSNIFHANSISLSVSV